ncbi:MAG: hypothetical protein Q4C36_05365 [Coriobacteriia bacterium]|nr:hypothetical protein [Coriobacteriia bacterium]
MPAIVSAGECAFFRKPLPHALEPLASLLALGNLAFELAVLLLQDILKYLGGSIAAEHAPDGAELQTERLQQENLAQLRGIGLGVHAPSAFRCERGRQEAFLVVVLHRAHRYPAGFGKLAGGVCFLPVAVFQHGIHLLSRSM